LLDSIILDIFLLFNFMSILIYSFKQYHSDKMKKYKILDDIIKPYISNELIDRIKEYNNEQKVFEKYNINNQ